MYILLSLTFFFFLKFVSDIQLCFVFHINFRTISLEAGMEVSAVAMPAVIGQGRIAVAAAQRGGKSRTLLSLLEQVGVKALGSLQPRENGRGLAWGHSFFSRVRLEWNGYHPNIFCLTMLPLAVPLARETRPFLSGTYETK